MLPYLQTVQLAVSALQRISETTPGERGRRASVVALVLRSIESIQGERADVEFLSKRAEIEVDTLAAGSERSLLRRILSSTSEDSGGLVDTLTEYGAALEGARRLEEADAVMRLARSLAPGCAEGALRCARLARLQGDRQGALDLYERARELDGGNGPIARLARIGEALVAEDPKRALSIAIREAVKAGDFEAAGVGLEERARVRRSEGDRAGAARDLAIAAGRFTDAVDKARVAHQVADLFIAGGDPLAAREALYFILGVGESSQRQHARGRLHAVSREIGDQIGMRRWRSFDPPKMVSLSGRGAMADAKSAAATVARWRERLMGSTSERALEGDEVVRGSNELTPAATPAPVGPGRRPAREIVAIAGVRESAVPQLDLDSGKSVMEVQLARYQDSATS